MSNGYLVAAVADLAAAHEIAAGFGLDVIDTGYVNDPQTTGGALAAAANVGLILSEAAARDDVFVALLGSLATRLARAQLILVTPQARTVFAFLPASWPEMSLEEARTRSSELLRRKQSEAPPAEDAPRAEPLPPQPEPAPVQDAAPPPEARAPERELEGGPVEVEEPAAKQERAEDPPPAILDDERERAIDPPPAPATEAEPAPAAPEPPAPLPEPPASVAEPPAAPPSVGAPAPAGPLVHEQREETPTLGGAAPRSTTSAPTAPADATAFAPSKLRRGTPELVRIAVHQPKDLNAVIKAAKKIDPTTEPAPQGMPIGDVALGSSIGVALEVRGGACDGALQRREWQGVPIDFNFAVEADASVKQVVMLARVFINDAQIGVLAFTRNVSGPAKKPHGPGDRARLKRHKRVFLSYSAKDRETVSAIATAYQMAGVEHFWDRASLKSGEEWHPRLRREIDRADLFHLCWSKSAAESEWVQKEAEHALTRRRKNSGKPEITVQMLDGPPWAAHPATLDSINFDDFVRAAIVGYARGDGS
jgi:hypothetical protein